ncbi:hypothetical protein OPQ81_009271 [Rhizoctonia solani]|nr:hypothetical protein OPQ81_009271 [Rhizoctonia solani]
MLTEHEWNGDFTVISCADAEEIVSVAWKAFGDAAFTMHGRNAPLIDLLEMDNKLGSGNRFFNNASGQRLQWKILTEHLYVGIQTSSCVRRPTIGSPEIVRWGLLWQPTIGRIGASSAKRGKHISAYLNKSSATSISLSVWDVHLSVWV